MTILATSFRGQYALTFHLTASPRKIFSNTALTRFEDFALAVIAMDTVSQHLGVPPLPAMLLTFRVYLSEVSGYLTVEYSPPPTFANLPAIVISLTRRQGPILYPYSGLQHSGLPRRLVPIWHSTSDLPDYYVAYFAPDADPQPKKFADSVAPSAPIAQCVSDICLPSALKPSALNARSAAIHQVC